MASRIFVFETARKQKNETLLYRLGETEIPPAEDGIASAGGIFYFFRTALVSQSSMAVVSVTSSQPVTMPAICPRTECPVVII